MSKNFELLTQLGEQFDLFQAESPVVEPRRTVVPPSAETRPKVGSLLGARSAEELTLIQRVFFAPGLEAPKTVVFCGVDRGEEASFLCARAGEILASRAAGDVCLIDADLHAPSLHRHYGLENSCGFTDVVLDLKDARSLAYQIGGGALWLLPAGLRTAERPAVLSPDRLGNSLSELRQQFSYVLISAPPANLYPDAILLGQPADGVVLVIKANSTRRVTALKVKESLEASNVRVLGAILTDRVFPIPEALYRKL